MLHFASAKPRCGSEVIAVIVFFLPRQQFGSRLLRGNTFKFTRPCELEIATCLAEAFGFSSLRWQAGGGHFTILKHIRLQDWALHRQAVVTSCRIVSTTWLFSSVPARGSTISVKQSRSDDGTPSVSRINGASGIPFHTPWALTLAGENTTFGSLPVCLCVALGL